MGSGLGHLSDGHNMHKNCGRYFPSLLPTVHVTQNVVTTSNTMVCYYTALQDPTWYAYHDFVYVTFIGDTASHISVYRNI
jgi:hypothetical protein